MLRGGRAPGSRGQGQGGRDRGHARVPHHVRGRGGRGRDRRESGRPGSCRPALALSPAAATLAIMDAPRGDPADSRYAELRAEAAESLSYSANALRAVRDRYRQAWLDDLAHWETLRNELTALERTPGDDAEVAGSTGPAPVSAETAAEAGAAAHRLRTARGDVARSQESVGRQKAELSRLELAIRNLESTWLFLERGDASLIN